MIIFPSRPEPTDILCGLIGIPEEIDFYLHEGPDDDEFVKVLIEIMSKPIGGAHGEDQK